MRGGRHAHEVKTYSLADVLTLIVKSTRSTVKCDMYLARIARCETVLLSIFFDYPKLGKRAFWRYFLVFSFQNQNSLL